MILWHAWVVLRGDAAAIVSHLVSFLRVGEYLAVRGKAAVSAGEHTVYVYSSGVARRFERPPNVAEGVLVCGDE